MTTLALLLCVGAVWTTDGTDSLLARVGQLDFANVSIGRDEQVDLAPRLDLHQALVEAQVWQIVPDRAGNVYCATGNGGRLYRLGRGSAEPVFDSGATEILAATSDPAGNVFFGSTPEGNVYRIRPGGDPELLSATGEGYVFALLSDSKGALYCATGPSGRLLRLNPGSNRADTIYAAPQTHLTALSWLVPDKELLIGTSPEGIVYRLALATGSSKPRVSVLFDTPLAEVRTLAADQSGRVYIGANAGSGGGDSAGPRVFCVRDNGTLQWSWAVPDSTVFAVALAAGTPTRSPLLVATGKRGVVYEVDTLGHAAALCRTDESQVLCLAPATGGTWLGTANPAKLYFLGQGYADSGYVASDAHDCSNPSEFGTLSCRAAVPTGTFLRLDTRSGNSSTPDSTWNPWAEAGTADNAVVRSPSARYVQWRARLASSFPDRTPSLERVDLYFRSPNRPPAISKLEVSSVSLDDARQGNSKSVRDISWTADDPDGDSLSFDLYFRLAAETRWQKLATDVAGTHRDLDTRALADGWYQVRLGAGDKPDQTPTTALSAEEMTRPFLVDNTPPAVSDVRVQPAGGDKATITFTARDALSPLAGSRVSVNAGTWLPVEPADRLFDRPDESFSASVELAPGDNVIAVIVTDNQGNQAAARTTVRH